MLYPSPTSSPQPSPVFNLSRPSYLDVWTFHVYLLDHLGFCLFGITAAISRCSSILCSIKFLGESLKMVANSSNMCHMSIVHCLNGKIMVCTCSLARHSTCPFRRFRQGPMETLLLLYRGLASSPAHQLAIITNREKTALQCLSLEIRYR